MSDLVERLRWLGYPFCIEAADEIERLQAALKEIQEWTDDNSVAAIAKRALEQKP